jgi:hypothetical protein
MAVAAGVAGHRVGGRFREVVGSKPLESIRGTANGAGQTTIPKSEIDSNRPLTRNRTGHKRGSVHHPGCLRTKASNPRCR